MTEVIQRYVVLRRRLLLALSYLSLVALCISLAPAPADAVFYAIGKSLRFNSSDGAYLNRTLATPTNNKIWTFSAWVKRGDLPGSIEEIFRSLTGASTEDAIRFDATNHLQVYMGQTTGANYVTTAVYRDPAQWLHIVVAVDTSQANSGDRVKIYVNGSRVTDFSTIAAPSLNYAPGINSAIAHYIGTLSAANSEFFDGYLADVYFVDGQQLLPSSFGQTDSGGYWRPKSYSGTYGINGFFLKFADSSSLGTDSSGNANTWTVNKLVSTDQTIDTPTNGYATGNPAQPSSGTFSDGALSNTGTQRATFFPTSGKWYWEVKAFGAGVTAGVITAGGTAVTTSVSNGTTMGFRFDADAGTLASTTDGVTFSGQVSSLTGGRFPYATGGNNNFIFGSGATSSLTYYPGSGGYFTYQPPSGYKALSTGNLPSADAAVPLSNRYFDAVLYLGSGATKSITSLNFQPDVVWLKDSSAARPHGVYDAMRGSGLGLTPNSTAAEVSSSTALTSFDALGFSLGADASANNSADNFVAWTWKKSTTAGVDVQTYTGDNTANRNITHGLGVAPEFVIVKRRDSTSNWWVWHTALSGATSFVDLNSTAAQTTTNTPWGTGNFSSTQFMVTNNATENANATGGTYVAYLFSGIGGFSKFGSYTGNGAADGTFVWTGFKPKLILIKRTDTTGDWYLFDDVRDAYNVATSTLLADTNAAQTNATSLDFLANGFKLRNTTAGFNANTGTYVFAAFADEPFKLSAAAPILSTSARVIRIRGGSHIRGGAHIRGYGTTESSYYSQSGYYSQGSYYSQSSYYSQAYYQAYYQSSYYSQAYYQAYYQSSYYSQSYYQAAYK